MDKPQLIEIGKAQTVIAKLKKQHAIEVRDLRAEIEALQARLAKEQAVYNNAPSKKRRSAYQAKLAFARQSVQDGTLTTLGRATLKRHLNCGDTVAASIQAQLVDDGIAVRLPGGQCRLAA